MQSYKDKAESDVYCYVAVIYLKFIKGFNRTLSIYLTAIYFIIFVQSGGFIS